MGMGLDLLLRHLLITIAVQLACAWVQTFQLPWPLVDAFELADNAEEQLLKSLGISLRGLKVALALTSNDAVVSFAFADRARESLSAGFKSSIISYTGSRQNFPTRRELWQGLPGACCVDHG